MTIDPIIDYLITHGEKRVGEIQVQGLSSRAIESRVREMVRRKSITRRQIPSQKGTKMYWVYKAVESDFDIGHPLAQRFDNEPDYVYHLRNLPREIETNYDC
jgi:DNA-binding HxlR family transcriptional regulator